MREWAELHKAELRRIWDTQQSESIPPLVYVSGLFAQVKVDAGGYGISWNDTLDLSCEELYMRGQMVET